MYYVLVTILYFFANFVLIKFYDRDLFTSKDDILNDMKHLVLSSIFMAIGIIIVSSFFIVIYNILRHLQGIC